MEITKEQELYAEEVKQASPDDLKEMAEKTIVAWEADHDLTFQAKLLAARLTECDDIAPLEVSEAEGFEEGRETTWAEVAQEVLAESSE